MKLSVLIPCYNEERYILTVVENIFKNNLKKNLEIIITDDCSIDSTKKKLSELNDPRVKIFYNKKNMGKGYCIRKCLENSTGDIILIQDADLEYDPAEYDLLLSPIINHDADVVYGSRFLSHGQKRVGYFWHTLGNKILTFLSNILSNINLTDMEVCYKLFKSEVIKNIKLKENRFGFEPEVTAKLAKKKIKIYEVGINYHGRSYSEGKKINWKDGFSAIRCIIQYNLFH
tara:strand:- start:5 stop:694 length:690 start_codon:yes stop_codon:yes gene_type:complete